MRKICHQSVIPFILCCGIFYAPSTYAQTGWQWGLSNVSSSNPGFDVWSSTIDDSGNVLVVGNPGGPAGTITYTVYGADTVYNVRHVSQQIIVKADSNGHFVWAKGSQNGNCYPGRIKTDHRGNVYVFGYYYEIDSCSFDAITLHSAYYNAYYLVKYSPAGDVIWAKNVSGNDEITSGDMGIDGANNIYVTGCFGLRSITIGGTTLMNTSLSGDTLDVFVAKYDTLGNPVWAKSFGGHQDDYPGRTIVTQGGNIYISGAYESTSIIMGSDTLLDSFVSGRFLDPQPFFVKMDSSGNFIWAETLNTAFLIYDLTNDAFENIYMVGALYSDLILGHDTLIDVGATDVFLAKYDSSGDVVWANSAGGSLNEIGRSIALDKCTNNLWIAGSASHIMNFNDHMLTMPSGYDLSFIAEYNNSGIYLTGTGLSSGGDDYIGVQKDNNGNVYIVGDYWNSSMVLGPDTLPYPPGWEELFFAKYRYGCFSTLDDTTYNHIDTVVCAPSDATTITLTAQSGTNYLWYDGDTTSTHIEGSSGIYWVSYIATLNFIVDTFNVTFANTSPPCAAITITGVNIILPGSHNDVSIYPDPATTQITILSTSQTINQVAVTNILGQTMYSNQYNSPQVQIDVSPLPSGLYFIKVNGSEVRKFVKE